MSHNQHQCRPSVARVSEAARSPPSRTGRGTSGRREGSLLVLRGGACASLRRAPMATSGQKGAAADAAIGGRRLLGEAARGRPLDYRAGTCTGPLGGAQIVKWLGREICSGRPSKWAHHQQAPDGVRVVPVRASWPPPDGCLRVAQWAQLGAVGRCWAQFQELQTGPLAECGIAAARRGATNHSAPQERVSGARGRHFGREWFTARCC